MPFDSIELPHDGRYRRRITMQSDGGLVFLLDLPEATQLQHGDGLLLEDGRIISVVAAQEPVIEITAADPQQLARLAWHIGNRHVRAEILRDRIRIMPDAVIETMARRLGGKIRSILARFEPEGGAYSDAGLGAGAQASHRHEPHHQ
jgi:urease accessory protein